MEWPIKDHEDDPVPAGLACLAARDETYDRLEQGGGAHDRKYEIFVESPGGQVSKFQVVVSMKPTIVSCEVVT
jgi:hypothetical protein